MALTNILVLQYNNYFNRTIKHPTNPEYMNSYYNLTSYRETVSGVNFYKGDGVNAELTINTDKEGIDYLVEYDNTLLSPLVISRWFIIENKQTRSGQRQLTLRRDVIIDNLNSIVDAPIYVEKATIQNPNDVAIYNQEEISFNQIKKKEYLLSDSTKVPWIVGYYAKNTTAATINVPSTNTRAIKVSALADWPFYKYVGQDYKLIKEWSFGVRYDIHDSLMPLTKTGLSYSDGRTATTLISINSVSKFTKVTFKIVEACKSITNVLVNNSNILKTYMLESDSDLYFNDNISTLKNKIIFDASTSKYYRISITSTEGYTTEYTFTKGSTVEQNVNDLIDNNVSGYNYNPQLLDTANTFYNITATKYRITLTEISMNSGTVTIPATSNELVDAPYKMFCMPAGVIADNVGQFDTLTYFEALNVASCIAISLGSNLYDIQLLPYCPMKEAMGGVGGSLDYGHDFVENEDFVYVKDSNNHKIDVIFFPKKSTFNTDIYLNLSLSDNVIERKISNQCDMYRISSPNYSANFDFNLVRTGSITKFNVDCTYKPYNPYIHVNPNWSYLYGQDYDDIRGLICQGDFSLPIINDQWKQYQINNKNYLNAFNRQVESVELNNKYTRISEALNVGTGTVSGAISGGVMGGVPGAIVGGTASAAGGIADMAINEKLRRDSLDLTRDQFNYSLENIKALPNSLAKVSSIDANNKLFPVLEYYSCTEQEKDILKNKMKYNGMMIMRIATLREFESTEEQYFKGKAIKLEELSEDYHMANSIADELNKGVFIKYEHSIIN